MRIAYIGLSSPTAYYYDYKKRYIKRSDWGWTPILESPQGLLTLFDEVWFLHKALCPLSMMEMSYVKFLNQDNSIASQLKPILEGGEFTNNDQKYIQSIINPSFKPNFNNYTQIIKSVFGKEPSRDIPIDNHTHYFNFLDVRLSGNSLNKLNIILDLLINKKLIDITRKNIELVTNRFTSPGLTNQSHLHNEIIISEGITIRRIPVLQRFDGPEITGIEDLRDNDYLSDFRKKITSTITSDVVEDTKELISQIEKEYQVYKNVVLLKFLKDAQIMNSVGKNAFSVIAGKLIPGSVEVLSLIKDTKTRMMNWTGFIASLDFKEGRKNGG